MRFLMLVGTLLAAADVHAADAIDRLNRFFTEVSALRGKFVQEVFDEKGDIVQTSAGSFQLSRPGRFRWHYESPYDQLIVADGVNLWIYDAELEQATVKPIEDALTAAPVRLLTELRPLEGDFKVQAGGTRSDLDWVELTPRQQESEFQRVAFGLNASGVRRMDLYDQFGQKTVVLLEDLESDIDTSPALFKFTVPKGVDVVGTPRIAGTAAPPKSPH